MSKWVKKDVCEDIRSIFLRNMGVKNIDEVNNWFVKYNQDGYRLDRSDEFISFIGEYKNKPVRIVGDYDVDGITSTSILLLGLQAAGFTNLKFRIPKRFSEGFGINKTIVDEIAGNTDPEETLIITCDNGIAQYDAISYAILKGFHVIIIDHHLPEIKDDKALLPPADIIIDPSAISGSADFDSYCGAGLCYKLMRKLIGKNNSLTLLTLAALGTVADVMPLRQENYVIVKNGLKALNNGGSTAGINILIDKCNLKGHITSKDISFKLAPVLNSVSRLHDDGAKYAVALITGSVETNNKYRLPDKIIESNEERKQLKNEAIKKAHNLLDTTDITYPLVLFIPNMPEGIVGIIAGSIAEEYKTPTIVLTEPVKGLYKGSARTYGNYDVKGHLDKVSECLENYGGHVGAAGLSLKKENFERFKSTLISVSDRPETDIAETAEYDLEITAEEVPTAIEELLQYEPFGEGNSMPRYKVNFFVTQKDNYDQYVRFMGPERNFVKLISETCCAVSFNTADKLKDVTGPIISTLYGTLSNNYYNGTITGQVDFEDIEF